jgi:hypothetical protein
MVFTTGCDRKASSAQKPESRGSARSDLWRVYNRSLKGAKYIDLTHTLMPSIPVWKGCNFSTRNATSYFTATSLSTPIPLRTSKVKLG